MLQILKRLELIKTSITLEDEEIIELQINKIKSLEHDSYIDNILSQLEQNDFANAVSAIDDYINKNTGLIPYEDQAVQGLKLELKVLERQLENLTEKKNDYTIDIDDFNREYSLNLGDIIQKVLNLREEILYQQVIVKESAFQAKKDEFNNVKDDLNDITEQAENIKTELDDLDEFSDEYEELYEQYEKLKEELSQKENDLNDKRKEAKQAKDDLDDDPVNDEYKEAKEDSETFDKEYKEVIADDAYYLTKEQQKELKDTFRKASRLCHPDIVADDLKYQAHKIMTELNLAKKKKDLEKIKEILHSLQSGMGFEVASDTVNDKELLKNLISNIMDKISLLESEINDLESSETYNTIQEIDDKDEYFNELKTQLDYEFGLLEKELRQLKNGTDSY